MLRVRGYRPKNRSPFVVVAEVGRVVRVVQAGGGGGGGGGGDDIGQTAGKGEKAIWDMPAE